MIQVIPAIDIISGKCVRLTHGDFSQKKIYDDKPWEVAMRFEDAGIKRLHLVDLDGARQGSIVNIKVLEEISKYTKLIIDFGGGIKTHDDVRIAFNSGASMISTGSIALKNSALFKEWLKEYGAGKIIAAADSKNEKVSVSGWQEESLISIHDYIKELVADGAIQVICTDISKDGSLSGPAIELYKKIIKNTADFTLIASGGISGLQDIIDLEKAGCKQVIIGKAIYEGKIKLNELTPFIL